MKRKIINIIAALALVGGLIAAATAPWWAVWLLILPVVYLAALALLKVNTKFIDEL